MKKQKKLSKYEYHKYFDESYFNVSGDRGWYNEEAFALENEWHKDYAEYVVSMLSKIKKGKLLDVGCARGNVIYWLRKMGFDAYGIDVSEWAIKNNWVRKKTYCVSVTDCIPCFPEFFDVIISRETLEHIYEKDIYRVIHHLADALKKGGKLFIEVATNRGDKEEKKKSNPDNADPSHVLIKSLTWWKRVFEAEGLFKVDHERSFEAMHSGMGYRYSWDILILERM